MHLPADALRSDEASGDAAPAELPFLAVHRHLTARGVRVPRVLADDVPRRVVLLEDLGDETFEARLAARPAERERLYERAVDLLADLHARCAAPDPGCLVYGRAFDETLLRWELEHFREWGLVPLGGVADDEAHRLLDAPFDALARELAALPRGFVHRDYQSRNLMWVGDELVVIDFQDALLGPLPYDLVALLCDSYVALDEALVARMIARYADARGLAVADLERTFWKVAAQRKLKDAARFVFIDRVRKNASFLAHVPQSFVHVGRALARVPALSGVDAVLRARIRGYPDAVPIPVTATK
jgi:aminoglycoside/choline kinase family phosphotransferase